jgi:hypothetical protein
MQFMQIRQNCTQYSQHRTDAGKGGQNRTKQLALALGIEVEQEMSVNQAGQQGKITKIKSGEFLSPVQLHVVGRNDFIGDLGRAACRVKVLHPL